MLRVELEYRGQWRCEGSRGCDMGECRGGGVGVQGWWRGEVQGWWCRGPGMGECRDNGVWRRGGVGVQG